MLCTGSNIKISTGWEIAYSATLALDSFIRTNAPGPPQNHHHVIHTKHRGFVVQKVAQPGYDARILALWKSVPVRKAGQSRLSFPGNPEERAI